MAVCGKGSAAPDKKLRIPACPDGIWRNPVFSHIFEAAGCPLTVVNAASGYGKTAMLAFEALRSDFRVLWYQMDHADNEPEFFLDCLARLWGLADEGREDSARGRRRLMELFDRAAGWQEPLFLVFDNMEAVESPEVLEYLELFVRYMPVRLVFVTRAPLPRWLLLPLLNGQGRLIAQEDLRLGADAAAELSGGVLSEETVSAVLDALCGWPLGVSAILDYLKRDAACEPPFDWLRLLERTRLEEYLDREFMAYGVLEQELLKRLALFDSFDWELCLALEVDGVTRKLFRELMGRSLFVRGGGDCSFGEAYRAYLLQMTDQGQQREMYRRAAAYYMERQCFAQMADYAVRGGQEELLVSALEQYGEELLAQEGQPALDIILSFLGKRRIPLSPEANGIAAQHAYFSGDYDKMERCLNEADSQFGKENCFGSYRSLYKALLKYGDDPEKYARQIHHALFFLRESGAKLPYLHERERRLLDELTKKRAQTGTRKLTVCSLGTFRVFVTEDMHELSWRTKKGCELFAYLVDAGKPVERKQLLEVLWRDEMPQNAVAMLHNMIYNIRKELSDYQLEGLLVYKNRRYQLDMEAVEWDMDKVRRAAELLESGQAAELWQNRGWFDSYWGRYLEDIDNHWAGELQRYYDEVYKRGCNLLAEEALRREEPESAMRFYRNILSMEPYDEEVCEKLLLLYGGRKDWRRLKELYTDFERLLLKDLGIEPGDRLKEIYRGFGLQNRS